MRTYPQGKVSGTLPAASDPDAALVHEIIVSQASDQTTVGHFGVVGLNTSTLAGVIKSFPAFPTTAVSDACSFRVRAGERPNGVDPTKFATGGAPLLITYLVI